MARRVLAEIQCLCYPRAAIPALRGSGFVVADVLAQRMNFSQGDTFGLALQGFNPTITDSWMQNQGSSAATFTSISPNLDWVRFGADGRFYEGSAASGGSDPNEPQGFILQGREAPLDCIIPAPDGAPAAPDTPFFNQTWRAVKGKWRSVLPPGTPQRVWLINSGSDAEAIAETVGMIPGNRSCRVDFRFSGLGGGSGVACRFAWGAQVAQETESSVTTGPQWSIAFRHDQKPSLEQNIDGRWVILRRLNTSFLCNLTSGRYILRIRRVNGYLVVSVNGEAFHFLQTSKGVQSGSGNTSGTGGENPDDATQPEKNNASQETGVPWTWNEGYWQVTANGTRVQFGTMLIKYANAGDTPTSGSFSRSIPRRAPIWGTIRGWASGWIPPGAASAATLVTPNQGIGVDYTCTLTASEQGLDTPFVNKVMVYSQPVWVQGDLSPIDVAPAISNWSVSKAMPPDAAGEESRFDIDRTVLNRHASNWENYAQRYNPIEFQIRWQYDDDSYGPWVKLFKGYLYQDSRATQGIHQNTMSLVCRDPILRLQAPAAVIDHRYPPMDVVWNNSGKATFFGSDAVGEILKLALGPNEAARLNGNGNGQRFFASTHYPLFSTANDVCGYFNLPQQLGGGMPATFNGFRLPPPHGEDALGWIRKISEFDHAVFFYGWPDGSNADEWPAPMYGRLSVITGGRTVKYIEDVSTLRFMLAKKNKLLSSCFTRDSFVQAAA